MNNDRELMQDALDALNNFDKGNHGMRWQVPLIKALRARLAQPEPAECDGGQCGIGGYCKECPKTKPEPEPEKSQDKPCVEDDGCPTEKAVLQRFWREHQAQPEPAECDGGQCGIGGYCKQCPKTKSDVPETAFGEIKPVLYQVRGRPNWDTEPKWGEWKFCTEPVANDYKKTPVLHDWEYQVRSLYTVPPQREWVGLTEGEYEAMAEQYVTNCYFDTLKYAKAIEAKLKEKNNG